MLDGKNAILSVARDLTERRRAEAERIALENQLRQAQKMEEIGRLAGGIAHDFNNLLTVIRGSASLALAELPPGEGPREDLEQIEQASDRAAEADPPAPGVRSTNRPASRRWSTWARSSGAWSRCSSDSSARTSSC